MSKPFQPDTPHSGLPQSRQPVVQRAAEQVLADAVRRQVCPGAAFGVLTGGAVAALGSTGHFTYQPDSSRVSPHTSYDLASLTKVTATSAVAMLLWQEGRLPLDTLLADVLPGFVIGASPSAQRRRVTLHMLLAHASGLPATVPFYERCTSREELLREALHLPLAAEPGTRTAYSDPGFILLATAIESIAGNSLDTLARDLVFAPLGMRRTGYRPAPHMRLHIPPTEQDQIFRGRMIQGEVHDENAFVLGGVSGHAGLFAPVEDLLLFAQAMLAPLRTAAADTLYSAEAVRLFTTRAAFEPGSSRALGWDTPSGKSSAGHHFSASAFGHLGFTGTSIWIDPFADTAVVLLTNRTYPTRENKGIQSLRPEFHDAVMQALGYGTYDLA